MKRLEENNPLYNFVRQVMNATFPSAYRHIEVHGLDNLPGDGAVIFGPNHSNGLMDALAVIYAKRGPVTFVARADVFRNPTMAKFMNFCKMMPIMRPRDGRENMSKNDAIMRRSVEILESGLPFCIMPEGTHRTMHSQMPLVKGIFRIALMATDELGAQTPVSIIPTGLEYGSHFRYRSTLRIEFGKPIDVRAFIEPLSAYDQAEQINFLRDELAARISELHLIAPDNDNYLGYLECCYLGAQAIEKEEQVRHNDLTQRLKADQKIIAALKQADNEALLQEATEVARIRRKKSICADAVTTPKHAANALLYLLFAIISSPIFLVAAAVHLPVWLLGEIVCLKTDDDAMKNSYRYLCGLFLQPITVVVWTIIAANFLPITYTILVFFFISFIANQGFIYDYARWMHRAYSHCRLALSRGLNQRIELLRQKTLALFSK